MWNAIHNQDSTASLTYTGPDGQTKVWRRFKSSVLNMEVVDSLSDFIHPSIDTECREAIAGASVMAYAKVVSTVFNNLKVAIEAGSLKFGATKMDTFDLEFAWKASGCTIENVHYPYPMDHKYVFWLFNRLGELDAGLEYCDDIRQNVKSGSKFTFRLKHGPVVFILVMSGRDFLGIDKVIADGSGVWDGLLNGQMGALDQLLTANPDAWNRVKAKINSYLKEIR